MISIPFFFYTQGLYVTSECAVKFIVSPREASGLAMVFVLLYDNFLKFLLEKERSDRGSWREREGSGWEARRVLIKTEQRNISEREKPITAFLRSLGRLP